MMKLRHEFVTTVPEKREEGVVYISMEYRVAIHSCCCGCGKKVVTPFSPNTGWKLIFDGKTISLEPSIGNWNFKCRSHYWITNSTVEWADTWTDEKISISRQRKESEMRKKPKKKKPGFFQNLFNKRST